MITDSTLAAVAAASDQTVLVEIYSTDATPTDDGFDPSDALKRYAAVGGLTFAGESYEKLLKSKGSSRRTTDEEANTFNFEIDNLEREASDFEFSTGYEGCVVVKRLISRSLSTTPAQSIILFAGRCDKPLTGSKVSLPITAKGIIHTVDMDLPRRKFMPEDPEGRSPSDPLFEGFRFLPQYGTYTYSSRVRRGGFFGMLGFKKTITNTAQWSSISDLDVERSLSEVLGRCQIAGVHLSYADTGIQIEMTTAFCEGQVQSIGVPVSEDPRFPLSDHPDGRRVGELGGTGDQIPHTNPAFPGNGIYSRTALAFLSANHTDVAETDPAPLVYTVVLGRLMTIPDDSDDWTIDDVFSDDPAAQTRFLITNSSYFNLNTGWIDDATFAAAYRYNNEFIFDAANSDVLFLPDTANFDGPTSELSKFHLSTGNVNAAFLKYLAGDATADEAFRLTPNVEKYDTEVPIEPEPPVDPPGGGTTPTPNLTFFLRRRYTSNVVFTEPTKLIDALNKVLFKSARLFLTQGHNGKLKLGQKKPVDWCLGTAAFSGTSIAVDDITAWVASKRGYVLIDPHTDNSEVRAVTDANYSTGQNSVTLTVSADLSKTDFAGCDGGDTPATATITVDAITPGDPNTVTIDGTEFTFIGTAADTVETAAGFLYGTINSHPILRRRFVATWVPGTATVTIKGKFGSLVVASALAMTHVAPLANPTAAAVATATGSGSDLAAGVYFVTYSDVNARGETLVSAVDDVTLTAGQKIAVASLSLAAGATARNWYVSPSAGSLKLRLHSTRAVGTAFEIDTLPALTAGLTPDVNRTGCEVMRVEALFADAASTRANVTRSNVLKASYKWRLGNRKEAVNRISLKYRDSTQDFRLVELRLRDDASIAKTKKTNTAEINGQAIDNYHQAYRIASGELAERQTADFFYDWKSDKAAVLLEEGDVVCHTDDGSGVTNFPVRIEKMEFEDDKGMLAVNFIGRKYSTTLYDDSVAEREIPVIIDTEQALDYETP